jgi:Transglutaminase-like superfamily
MKASARRRIYLREATIMLVLAQLAVKILPPARVFAWAGRAPRRIRRFATDEAGWVCWAVDSAGVWTNALCLSRALAAQTMLRRRGIASQLCLGVAREGGVLTAHAWVEVRGSMVVGGAEAARFTRMAEFGGERACGASA